MTNLLLAIESSCDETAGAVIDVETGKILASLVSSQIALHREHGGVVPELACRNHSLDLPPLIARLVEESGVKLKDFRGFAATRGPGLASSLLVGFAYSKGLATSTSRPFFGINHLEGHLLSPFLDNGETLPEIPPHLSLIVSGGHTLLIEVRGHRDYHLLGQTLDDAAGEAFDKVGRLLGLPYPGGPEIEKAAKSGDPTAFDFPRALRREGNYDFSFSGLKTSVRYTLEKLPQPQASLADLCASFQAAVCEILVEKALAAAKSKSLPMITLSGGVACNQSLQNRFRKACASHNLVFRAAPPDLTTDNAAMIALAAAYACKNSLEDILSLGIDPNLKLA